jgi:outer membrane receptor protein involved in Fe transport
MSKKLLLVGTIFSLFSSVSFAQDEEVTVIGSLIKGTPIDTGSPISTFDATSIASQNNLNIVELIKMVPGSSGMDGESNQFGSNGAEGVSNINMRGLGTNRTLVLINGKRQVTVPIRSGAGRSVNLHDLPMAALSRIEILKEGAAATYGSDAIAGVVNFITDSNFEGLKVNLGAKPQSEADSMGSEFSITYGANIASDTNFLISLGYQNKTEIAAKNTDYSIRSYGSNPFGGWSTLGNPATIVVNDAVDDLNKADGFQGGAAYLSDPGCNAAGGLQTAVVAPSGDPITSTLLQHRSLDGFCRYQYTYFDNVQEDQENAQLWMEFNGDVDGHDYHVEFAYGMTDVPHYATSPAYPPNDPFGNNVPSFHPGYQQLITDFPLLGQVMALDQYKDAARGPADAIRVRTRVMGAGGNPNGNSRGAETEFRKYDTYRLAFSFEGDLTEDIQYSTSLNYSLSEGSISSSDTQHHKFLASLWGYGGPNCDVELTALTTNTNNMTPQFRYKSTGLGVNANDVANANHASRNGCSYLNPFSNAIQHAYQQFNGYQTTTQGVATNPLDNTYVAAPSQSIKGTGVGERVGPNPYYKANLGNSAEFLDWLIDTRITDTESSLLTADFTMQGSLGQLAGGEAAWAFGYERREYNINVSLRSGYDLHDGAKYPCVSPTQNAADPEACRASPVGLFMFLPPTYAEDQDQTTDSLFTEFALPIVNQFDMQLGLRYEDYGSKDSVDPKIVMRWSPTDELTFRFTGQTTFRAPHPDEMSQTQYTELSYVAQAGAFKAVDIYGSTNLDPEEATTFNVGVITDFGTDNWTMTLDYYDFTIDNPIIAENYAQLAAAFQKGDTVLEGATDAPTDAETALSNAVGPQMYGGASGGQWNVDTNNFASKDIGRIRASFVNGPEIQTNGLDLFVKYDTDYANGTLSAGIEANWILKYSTDSYIKDSFAIAGAFDCAGFFNINNSCRSMPELKAKAFINYVTEKHNVYGALNHINAYDDTRTDTEIQAHTTLDANYTYSFSDEASMTFSVYNLTDEKPPFAFWDMSYDPSTHNPLGRNVKIGFTYLMN